MMALISDCLRFVTILCFFFYSVIIGASAGEDVGERTEQPLVGVYMPPTMIPPKITLISHSLIGDTIDVPTDGPIHLRCTGQRPMVWIIPHNHATWVRIDAFSMTHLSFFKTLYWCITGRVQLSFRQPDSQVSLWAVNLSNGLLSLSMLDWGDHSRLQVWHDRLLRLSVQHERLRL